MLFCKAKPLKLPQIVTSQGLQIDSVSCHRYLRILIDYPTYSSTGKQAENLAFLLCIMGPWGSSPTWDHCLFYEHVGWSLSTRRQHWRILLYKSILVFFYPTFWPSSVRGALELMGFAGYFLSVCPKGQTWTWKKSFGFAAPFVWNGLQKDLKLHALVSDVFKKMLQTWRQES